jgi:hypothetical protein
MTPAAKILYTPVKWNNLDSNLPRHGWIWECLEDYGPFHNSDGTHNVKKGFLCDFCGTRARYGHYISHPDWWEGVVKMLVGCHCCTYAADINAQEIEKQYITEQREKEKQRNKRYKERLRKAKEEERERERERLRVEWHTEQVKLQSGRITEMERVIKSLRDCWNDMWWQCQNPRHYSIEIIFHLAKANGTLFTSKKNSSRYSYVLRMPKGHIKWGGWYQNIDEASVAAYVYCVKYFLRLLKTDPDLFLEKQQCPV